MDETHKERRLILQHGGHPKKKNKRLQCVVIHLLYLMPPGNQRLQFTNISHG